MSAGCSRTLASLPAVAGKGRRIELAAYLIARCTGAPVQGISAGTASSVRARLLMRADIVCCAAATVWAWSEKS